jgi:hypothetical protein
MIVGFTGTRFGMNYFQYGAVSALLGLPDITEFRHGCCQGSDEQAHKIADYYDIPIIGHPPDKTDFTSKQYLNYKALRTPKPYLERNHDIVDASDTMIATPKENEEVLRSGTWATIRYAKKTNTFLYLVLPIGRVEVYANT